MQHSIPAVLSCTELWRCTQVSSLLFSYSHLGKHRAAAALVLVVLLAALASTTDTWNGIIGITSKFLPNRELPSLGFSNHVTSSFSVMHLLSCNLLPIQVFGRVLRIPAILRRAAMGSVSCSVFFLECAMSKWKHDIGEVTLYDYMFLWWMEERNQLLGAATEFQKLIAKLFKTILLLISKSSLLESL